MSRRLFYSETLQEAYVRVQILWCHINLGKRRHGWDKRCIVLCPRGVQNSSLSFVVSHKVFAQGKWFTKMLSVCKGQQRICGSRIRRSLERRSHCLEIQIFAAAQSQLCQLFYNRMFVCVNSSSESTIVFLSLSAEVLASLPLCGPSGVAVVMSAGRWLLRKTF